MHCNTTQAPKPPIEATPSHSAGTTNLLRSDQLWSRCIQGRKKTLDVPTEANNVLSCTNQVPSHHLFDMLYTAKSRDNIRKESDISRK